jgi:Big-like domain-containing protein
MVLGALAVAPLSSCADAVLTAPPGSSMTLFANPDFIPATGGKSVISAVVTEPAGTLVPDGTVVQFFTNLGQIEPQGKTHNGVAQVNLLSDGRSGTAKVTALSGGSVSAPSGASGATASVSGASSTVNVTIGPVPATVFVSAAPNRLTDSRTSHISALVFDAQNNPVPNVQVIFSINGNPTTEHLDSAGLPVFTDNNGVAQDILRSQLPFDAAPKTVTITATTPNGKSGTTLVTIN